MKPESKYSLHILQPASHSVPFQIIEYYSSKIQSKQTNNKSSNIGLNSCVHTIKSLANFHCNSWDKWLNLHKIANVQTFVPTRSSFLICKYEIITNQSISGYIKSVNIYGRSITYFITFYFHYFTRNGSEFCTLGLKWKFNQLKVRPNSEFINKLIQIFLRHFPLFTKVWVSNQ